jgi:hypothetical protein
MEVVESGTGSKWAWGGIAIGTIPIIGISGYNVFYFSRLRSRSGTTAVGTVDVEAQFVLNIVILVFAIIIFLIALYQFFEGTKRVIRATTAVGGYIGSGLGTIAGAVGPGVYISPNDPRYGILYPSNNAVLNQAQVASAAVANAI